MARLRRVSDGAGDVGSMSLARKWDEKEHKYKTVGHRPRIGCSMIVGSVTARSYSLQDYWMTTAITKILERKKGYVRFLTENSEYEWWI
jgi:hypothetical protein